MIRQPGTTHEPKPYVEIIKNPEKKRGKLGLKQSSEQNDENIFAAPP